MTTKTIIERLRASEFVKLVKSEFTARTGGLLWIDERSSEECGGCSLSSVCECVNANPELHEKCIAEHKLARKKCNDGAVLVNTCHVGMKHMVVPLHYNAEVIAYIRCGGVKSEMSEVHFKQFESLMHEQKMSDKFLSVLEDVFKKNMTLNSSEFSLNLLWVVEQGIKMNVIIAHIADSG